MIQCQERLLEHLYLYDHAAEMKFGHKAYCNARCNLTQISMSRVYAGNIKKDVLAERKSKCKKDILVGCEMYCPVLNKEKWEEINKDFKVIIEKR